MNRVVPLALVALVASLGLVACGGGSGSSDEDQIHDISERALTANDPASCDEIVTERFIQLFYNGSLEQCKKNAEDTSGTPDSVDVTDISVKDAKATATITLVGGSGDGQKLAASYVKQNGQWKFDTIAPGPQDTGTTTSATTGTGSTATGQTTTGDPLTDLFFGAIRRQLTKSGQSDAVADCIVGKLQTSITPADIAQLKAGKRPPDLPAKTRTAGQQCAQQSLSGD
jgi:hypothetical protein